MAKRVAFDRERLTVDATPVSLTRTIFDGDPTIQPRREAAAVAEIHVLTNGVIVTRNGAVPSAGVGQPLAVGDVIVLDSYREIAGFRAIKSGASAGDLEVIYFY